MLLTLSRHSCCCRSSVRALRIRQAAERQPSSKDEEGEMKELQLRQRGLTFRGRLYLEEETDFSRSGGAD